MSKPAAPLAQLHLARGEPQLPSRCARPPVLRPRIIRVRYRYRSAPTSILAGLLDSIMPLSDFHVRASIAVSDIQRAVEFYESKLGLQAMQSGPSATIADGSRVYGSGGGPALNVYQSVTAGTSRATMATWYVVDIEQVVDELTAAGVEFARYDEIEHDAAGITARAGGGRIAWFQDPDGNTFAIEADD